MKNLFIDANDGHKIPIYIKEAANEKAVLQLVHDSIDNSSRYFDIQEELAGYGITTVNSDTRGHNKSVSSPDELLYFGDHNGWNNCTDDIHVVNEYMKTISDKPRFVLGMGIGSMLVRTFLFKYGEDIDGAILIGSLPYVSNLKMQYLEKVVNFYLGKYGSHYRSEKLYNRVLKHLNKKFKDTSGYSYISSDLQEQDNFRKNPLNLGIPTISLYKDILNGIRLMQNDTSIHYVPDDLRILFMAGSDDAFCGSISKQKSLVSFYASKGKNASLAFFDKARHDILHDYSRDQAIKTILDFIEGSNAFCPID